MNIITQSTQILENKTLALGQGNLNSTTINSNDGTTREEIILIIQSTTASVGIVANLTVIMAFLNHKKLRRKIPNIFIINQVRTQNETLFIAFIKIWN